MLKEEMSNRGITYIGWKCNLFKSCILCYYRWEPWDWNNLREVKANLIRQRFYYGLTHTDISGGEPLAYPHIKEVLDFCDTIGIKPRIITNGILINEDFDNRVESWLISIQGVKEDHNRIVRTPTFDIIMKNLKKIKKPYSVNCVITDWNYEKFPEYAKMITKLEPKPTQVNMITFNPFGKWAFHDMPFMPDLSKLNKPIKELVDILEKENIEVAVRYLPFCFAEGFEKNCVGFSQCTFDDKEWNWAAQLKAPANQNTPSFGIKRGRETAINNSAMLNECRKCSMELICDGLNRNYLRCMGKRGVKAKEGQKIFDPLYFFKKERGEKE